LRNESIEIASWGLHMVLVKFLMLSTPERSSLQVGVGWDINGQDSMVKGHGGGGSRGRWTRTKDSSWKIEEMVEMVEVIVKASRD